MEEKYIEAIMIDSDSEEDGEEQLSAFMIEAGNEARNRRKTAFDQHFEKLKQIIKNAVLNAHASMPT